MQYRLRVLQTILDQLYSEYHRKDYLFSDPIEFVHKYNDPWDQETVALIAALLAYGNVKQIRHSIEKCLAAMHPLAPSGPAQFIRRLQDQNPKFAKTAEMAFSTFKHRFNTGQDMLELLRLLGKSWEQHGSLGAHFMRDHGPEAGNIGPALDSLLTEWKSWARPEPRNGGFFYYLLSAPVDGSCCKRWCMFLRWMGRYDEVDPGLWSERGALAHTFPSGRFLRPNQLVIPLDTHTGRISQALKLTRRKTLDWNAAIEVTEALKSFDKLDPVRYDFALSRYGILRGATKAAKNK